MDRCVSRRSSSTDREDERVRARERVYRVRREERAGEGWKVERVGGPPRRMRLPIMCVWLWS